MPDQQISSVIMGFGCIFPAADRMNLTEDSPDDKAPKNLRQNKAEHFNYCLPFSPEYVKTFLRTIWTNTLKKDCFSGS